MEDPQKAAGDCDLLQVAPTPAGVPQGYQPHPLACV
jgi:hypothetical protein